MNRPWAWRSVVKSLAQEFGQTGYGPPTDKCHKIALGEIATRACARQPSTGESERGMRGRRYFSHVTHPVPCDSHGLVGRCVFLRPHPLLKNLTHTTDRWDVWILLYLHTEMKSVKSRRRGEQRRPGLDGESAHESTPPDRSAIPVGMGSGTRSSGDTHLLNQVGPSLSGMSIRGQQGILRWRRNRTIQTRRMGRETRIICPAPGR